MGAARDFPSEAVEDPIEQEFGPAGAPESDAPDHVQLRDWYCCRLAFVGLVAARAILRLAELARDVDIGQGCGGVCLGERGAVFLYAQVPAREQEAVRSHPQDPPHMDLAC